MLPALLKALQRLGLRAKLRLGLDRFMSEKHRKGEGKERESERGGKRKEGRRQAGGK